MTDDTTRAYFLDRNGVYVSKERSIELISLRVRPRFWRAMRAPWFLWQIRKTGMTWRTACRLTWLVVTYRGAV